MKQKKLNNYHVHLTATFQCIISIAATTDSAASDDAMARVAMLIGPKLAEQFGFDTAVFPAPEKLEFLKALEKPRKKQ